MCSTKFWNFVSSIIEECGIFLYVALIPFWKGEWLATLVRANLTRVTSPSNSTPKTDPVLHSLYPSLVFTFHLLPSPVHPTGFYFCFFFFSDFFAIIILLSSNNNNVFWCSTTQTYCDLHLTTYVIVDSYNSHMFELTYT